MFNRTRIQLTIRNAAVLSVILVALNLSVYWVMQQMLFAQVDRSLTGAEAQIGMQSFSASAATSPKQTIMLRMAKSDRPVYELFWTQDMQPIPAPGSEAFTKEQLSGPLLPSRFGDSPKTVKLGDQYYRALKVEPTALAMTRGDGITYVVSYQLTLSNVTAEIGMLARLRNILLLGGGVGLLVAVAAGFYLANRALIPIRLSMERQQQFVSDASHELRTPLSVIQAHAELLLRHPEHTIEQDSKHVSTVLQEARRMSKLVGGLLTLARSDAGRQELEIKPVMLDRVIQDCVHKLQMLAEVKNIIVQAETEPSIPIQADEERLHQLLTIVLDNAIKYTPEGGLVRVFCRKLPHSVQLEVEDTGIGIAPEHLPRIFDRFYRSDKARTRQEGGTGLGLAIAKWIVERHGGKIRVESKLSVGTQVKITLPA
ncbi:sensor histidine kinase [Cohnella caldifontis]|uniref:sensor histidine kinase n=1 Tax=Cohnella caldifontis TaxID=3027471 RepID=UPI0023EAB850|nr:ATP-binding protein [Cohnella sp. YIM B05605]